MTRRPWMQQSTQGQQGLRITEPPSTNPEGMHMDKAKLYAYDDWSDEDTQPGLGPPRPNNKQENSVSQKPKEVERTNLMFVCGRYRSGFNLNVVVARDKGFKGKARTLPLYKMLNINGEFPVVLPDGNTAIVGEIYEITGRTFDFMDKLEECPQTQGRSIIEMEDGTKAHMYILPKWKAPHREEEIVSGDWEEWKKNERAREKEKKKRFLEMMKKGKEEAARRRALEEALEQERASTTVRNPTNHTGRLWNPIKGEWEWVKPSNDTSDIKKEADKSIRDITTYSSKNGKKIIHVSDADMSYLRMKLVMDGQNVPQSDSAVRAKFMSVFGVWCEIENVPE